MGTIHTYKCTRTSSSFPGSAWNALHGRLLPPVQRPCSPSTQLVPLRFVLARKTRSRLCTVGGIKPTLTRSANGNDPHVQIYVNILLVPRLCLERTAPEAPASCAGPMLAAYPNCTIAVCSCTINPIEAVYRWRRKTDANAFG